MDQIQLLLSLQIVPVCEKRDLSELTAPMSGSGYLTSQMSTQLVDLRTQAAINPSIKSIRTMTLKNHSNNYL